MKFAIQPIQYYPPHLRQLLYYLGKLKIQTVCRYLADMEENANELHFKCAPILIHVRV